MRRQVVSLPAPTLPDVVPASSSSSPTTTAADNPSTTAISDSLSLTSSIDSASLTASSTSDGVSSSSATTRWRFPTPSAGSELGFPPFKLVYLIPVIVVIGIIALIFLIWTIQGYCTRKSRKESVGGPRYQLPKNDDEARDVEKAAPHSPLDQEWYRAGYTADSLRGRRTSGLHSRRATPPSPVSFVTSGYYESDEDRDGAPWEVRNHKSIKRGILTQVQKEKNWMDSLRAVAGSVFVNQNDSSPTPRPARGVTLRDDGPVPRPPRPRRLQSSTSDDWIEEGRKRRSGGRMSQSTLNRTSQESDLGLGDYEHTSAAINAPSISLNHHEASAMDPGPGVWSPRTGFKFLQESPLLPPPTIPAASSPILHASFKTTPSELAYQAFNSPSNSQSNSLRYSYYHGRDDHPSMHPPPHFASTEARISFLPISPPQIMSPPLEGELCFIPAPGTTPALDGIATEVVESVYGERSRQVGKKRKETERSMGLSSDMFPDQPLPNPRSQEGARGRDRSGSGGRNSMGGTTARMDGADSRTTNVDGVDVIRLDKGRRKLFKKRSMLMGFRYERLSGNV